MALSDEGLRTLQLLELPRAVLIEAKPHALGRIRRRILRRGREAGEQQGNAGRGDAEASGEVRSGAPRFGGFYFWAFLFADLRQQGCPNRQETILHGDYTLRARLLHHASPPLARPYGSADASQPAIS